MTDPIVWPLSDRHVRADGVAVWAIVRNFRMTARSWLDHHRRLGVSGFLLLDDHSDDGTSEFLLREPDCIVLRSKYQFGAMIGRKRVNTDIKNAIIETCLRGRWGLHLDSDEYLFLPDGYGQDLSRLTATLDRRGLDSVNSSLVDFYPESPAVLFETPRAEYDPFAASSHFDRGPYVIWHGGGTPLQVHGGIRETLLRRYGMLRRLSTSNVGRAARNMLDEDPGKGLAYTAVYQEPFDRAFYDAVREELRAKTYLRASPWVFKTPLVKWTGDRRFAHDHYLDEPADTRICMAIAHFKFAPGLHESVPLAQKRKQYTQGSIQYSFYSDLLAKLRTETSLLHRKSVRFSSPADLETAGLLYDQLGAMPA